MKKLVPLVVLALVAAGGSAQAKLAGNGLSPNGLSPNGISPNGVSPNGISPNGLRASAVHSNTASLSERGFAVDRFTAVGITVPAAIALPHQD